MGCGSPEAARWEHRTMETTLEIPDAILHRAKAKAAQDRIPPKQFVTEAVAEKLETKSRGRQKARLAGKLRHLRRETARISALIEREFERSTGTPILNTSAIFTSLVGKEV